MQKPKETLKDNNKAQENEFFKKVKNKLREILFVTLLKDINVRKS